MIRTLWICLTTAALSFAAFAFTEVPKASFKALKGAKGKPFDAGLVFVNGKFLKPPYVVERWGNGIRINKVFVTGPVIDWSEFLKTQNGFKMTVTKTEVPAPAAAPAAAPAPASAPEPEPEVAEDDDSSLDDLFDDDPKPKKKKTAAKKPVVAPKVVKPPAPPKPKITASYSIEGDFVPNDATKAMVARINAVRTEIDRILRVGGFICFGDRYSRVTGDARTARELLEALPEVMQHSEDADAFISAVRQKQLYYLTDPVCRDIFVNRVDYRALQELRSKRRKDQEFQDLLKDAHQPLF